MAIPTQARVREYFNYDAETGNLLVSRRPDTEFSKARLSSHLKRLGTVAGHIEKQGYRVVVLARDPQAARKDVPNAADYVAWRAEVDGPWAKAVDGADAVINLAGAPLIGHRWTDSYKRQIRDSRVLGTRGLVNAMRRATVMITRLCEARSPSWPGR